MKKAQFLIITIKPVLLGWLFALPMVVSAASISINVSPNSVSSQGTFRLTMTSVGMVSCSWSRLDNSSTWAWQNQPIPGSNSTVYDSGDVSGWPGPTSYRWDFDCVDAIGGSYSASAWLSISGTPPPPPPPPPPTSPVPLIIVTPTVLNFGPTGINVPKELSVNVTNAGDPGSVLAGSVFFSNPDFSCISGCVYVGIGVSTIHLVVIEFKPSMPTPTARSGVANFTGGGGAMVLLSGSVSSVTPPPPPPPPPPVPVISVVPSPTLFFPGVLVGSTYPAQFFVKNVGVAGSLLTGSVTVVGGDFSCAAGCSYLNVPSGGTQAVTIMFAPTVSAGSRLAQVDFTGGGGATRFVNGTAVLPVSPTGALFFGRVIVGKSKVLDLTIRNTGPSDLGSGNLLLSPPFSCATSCAYTLPSFGNQIISVIFTPGAVGAVSQNATLSGVPGSSFTLSGVGVQGYWRMREK